MADGFVKEPAVVTRKNFNPPAFTPEAIGANEAGGRHPAARSVKVELETYARETGNAGS
jgi:type III restriction enzyme